MPVEADLAVLSRYPCLVFLGWNTMTEAIYEKLKAYVAAGGHLVMYLAHLNTETDRAAEPRLFRDGDFRDLFGVHIAGKGETDVRGVKYPAQSILANYRFPVSQPNLDPRFLGEFTPAQVEVTTARVLAAHDGNFAADPQELRARPVLVENRLGEGVAMLATVWEYPAHDGIVAFTRDLLRTVLAGEQGEIRLLSTDRVRYAVYDGTAPGSGRPFSVVYLLNTDPDCPALARLWIEEQTTEPFLLPANEMRLAYRLGDLVLLPEERHVDLKCWDEGEVALYSLHEQPITVCNLGAAETRISVNGRHLSLAPRASRTVSIAACPHPNRACFYAPNFLEEPPLEGVDTHTPY